MSSFRLKSNNLKHNTQLNNLAINPQKKRLYIGLLYDLIYTRRLNFFVYMVRVLWMVRIRLIVAISVLI